MGKWTEVVVKRKILEYVSLREEVELKLWIRKWKDWHPHRNNKNILHKEQRQRGYSFRTDEKEGKKSIPIMGWFRASVTVEILNVRWLFITWLSKEGKVYWWIKLQKFRAFKDNDNKQVLCWYYMQKRKFIIHPEYFYVNNIFLRQFIQNIKHKSNMVQNLSRQMNIALKKQR